MTQPPQPQQQQIDFRAAEQRRWNLLRSLELPPSTQNCRLRYLLETLCGVCGTGELTWPLDFLSARLSMPRTTLKKTIAYGVELGVLIRSPRKHASGLKDSNALAIDWSGLARHGPSPTDSPERTIDSPERTDRQSGADCTVGPERTHSVPVPKTVPPSEEGDAEDPAAAGEEEILIAVAGDTAWTEEQRAAARRSLEKHGVNASEVEELLDRCKSRISYETFRALGKVWLFRREQVKWRRPAGALHYRLRKAGSDSEDISAGWPDGEPLPGLRSRAAREAEREFCAGVRVQTV